MTSKERVLQAIKHKKTDRVPMFMDCTTTDVTQSLMKAVYCNHEEEMLKKLHIDCRWCTCMDDFISNNTYKDGTFKDMWGIEKTVFGGIPLFHPLSDAEEIGQLEEYTHWPNPDDIDYDFYVKQMKQHSEYAVFGGMWSPFLEQASMLMGMEKLMISMYDNEDLANYILDKTLDFYLECNTRMFEKVGENMQIFFMGDDYGTQQSLLYSPNMWRKYIKPRLKKLYNLAKSYGYIVQQHSCGSIAEIIPDLIEIGLDGLHPIQVSARGMDLEMLQKAYGEKLYFAGAIDAMHLLCDGTRQEIGQTIKNTMELFSAKGGFMFGPSQGFLPEIPTTRILLMYELGYKYGRAQ